MRKYIVVGVGGSGGATVRYIMDQLKADLRARGVNELPAAWQFLQVDVNPRPDTSPELGSIRDLGGRYVSVSTSSNTFSLVRQQVERSLQARGHLEGLLGWSPEPREDAGNVAVSEGAGQYRAIGRMLTLSRLTTVQDALNAAWQDLQQPTAWGEVSHAFADQRPSDEAPVVPIVVGSMAGGSGASMFLDVCRLMGRVRGLLTNEIGAFLFTPDVFHALDKSRRVGIDGNAMATLAEVVAAQARSADGLDEATFRALGVTSQTGGLSAFGRVLPIGSSIGGNGARFGETPDDVFRGLGRAIAATMISEAATKDFVQVIIENRTPSPVIEEVIGWGGESSEISWGSFGYASLSLGRDRYGEYVAQRLARIAVDRLVDGYKEDGSTLSPQDQLERALSAQRGTLFERIGLPLDDDRVPDWLRGELGSAQRQIADEALAGVLDFVPQASSQPKGAELSAFVQKRLAGDERTVADQLERGSYGWVEGYAVNLEQRLCDEVVRILAEPTQGLPFAREFIEVLANRYRAIAEKLAASPRPSTVLVVKDPTGQWGRHDNTAALREQVRESIEKNVKTQVLFRVAVILEGVLRSVADDLLPALKKALTAAQGDLEHAMRATDRQAGLAQLHTTVYAEWPSESVVPPRFKHAHNEVLLTTADDFPATFQAHVEAAAPGVPMADAIDGMVEQIIRGEWEDQGAAANKHEVIRNVVGWRAPALPRDAATGAPRPAKVPVYELILKPADLLDRASAFAARRDHHFALFTNQTFDAYLNEPGLSDSQREYRLAEFGDAFKTAVHQASPLVGVDAHMVEKIHGLKVRAQLTFSDVPVAPGSDAARILEAQIQPADGSPDPSVDRLREKFTAQSSANRIAIFGSYPKYLPVVFSTFLDQLKERWSNSHGLERAELWKWKRARPLPAALAMSSAEQSAMVKGWFLGRALGLVTHPDDPATAGPVQVFDLDKRQAVPFTEEFLTPRSEWSSAAWLPGVLEGHTLAIIECSGDDELRALQPYLALRKIYDSGDKPTREGVRTRGENLVRDWIATGGWPAGMPSPIHVVREAADTVEARAEALDGWLSSVQKYYEEKFLAPMGGPGVLSEARFGIKDLDHVRRSTLDGELALVIHSAMVDLRALVERALVQLRGPEGGHSAVQF